MAGQWKGRGNEGGHMDRLSISSHRHIFTLIEVIISKLHPCQVRSSEIRSGRIRSSQCRSGKVKKSEGISTLYSPLFFAPSSPRAGTIKGLITDS